MIDLKAKPFYLSDESVNWVYHTLDSLTTEEKLRQLFFPIGYSTDENYLKSEVLEKLPGGLMFRAMPWKELRKTYEFLQTRAKIPMFFAGNLESGGNGLIVEGTAYGGQMQIAATGKTENAYRLGKVSASEASAIGANYAFAPVVDIDMNYHNPITNVRTYGSDPDAVLKYAKEYIRAAKECDLAVAVKHFPGDGVDETDQHLLTSVNSLSCSEWDASYGKVYQGLIDEGALTVMAGHIAMPAYQKYFNPSHTDELVPASLSPELLNGLLREKLGFNGMIITDASLMAGFGCAMERRRAVPAAIAAGCDMFLFNHNPEEDYEYMKQGYETGILTKERLDEAVTRILAAKAAVHLDEKQKSGRLIPPVEAAEIIGCKKHLEWAEECADEAVTLVKDTQDLLPLDSGKTHRVLYEILGDFPSNSRVEQRFVKRMREYGFEMIPYIRESVSEDGTVDLGTVEGFKKEYDMVLYIANIENASSKTTNRINWFSFFGGGNNIPWFVKEVPTMFVSLGNPYHLLDVPMIKTYINCYANHDAMIDAVVRKMVGESEFKGMSPSDPFCGKDYLRI